MFSLSHLLLSTLFIFFFFLVFGLIVIFITSLTRHTPINHLTYNLPFIIILLLTLSLIISLPLNILAKEMVVTKDSFTIYLKITESPLTPTPTPVLSISSVKPNFITPLQSLIQQIFDWLRI